MPSRWDRLLDAKPTTLIEHLLEHAARRVAEDLARWPLPIDELDPAAARQFEAVLAEGRPRPSDAVFAESLRLTRWELERESSAYDDYMRNRRYLEHGLAHGDKAALLFITRWLVEQLLALGESTHGRVNRPRMLDCLERIERRLADLRAGRSQV